MGGGKHKSKLCLIIGLVLIVVAILADRIGLGSSAGFGWKQGLLVVVGICLLLCGARSCSCCCGSKEASEPSAETKSSE